MARLNLSAQDSIILDSSVPRELLQVIFTFGKGAKITAIAHAGDYFSKKENECELFLKEDNVKSLLLPGVQGDDNSI